MPNFQIIVTSVEQKGFIKGAESPFMAHLANNTPSPNVASSYSPIICCVQLQ